jgi:RNA-directed DNA polymerase
MSLLDELVANLRIGPFELMRIIMTAPARYKQYTIPKRRGGVRLIAQPSRELKALQRYVLQTKLSQFPIHVAATGYAKDKNILYNAEQHKDNRVILKMNFTDFFPSIKVRDWNRFVLAKRPSFIDPKEMFAYRNILFWGQQSYLPKCLSIGAPTSPALSNILLYDLDTSLARVANITNVIYTRYADDITVSGASIEAVKEFEVRFTQILRRMKSPVLTLNNEKRGIYLPGQRRMVTGLVVTPVGAVSIGRERKRLDTSKNRVFGVVCRRGWAAGGEALVRDRS